MTDQQPFDAWPKEPTVDVLRCGRPRYFLASMTYTPVGVAARWSMFALLRGTRRS